MKSSKFITNLTLGAFVSVAMLALAAPADAAKRGKYKEMAVADGGMVKGKVSFEGALPDDAIEKILITKNMDVCGNGEREVTWVDTDVDEADGTIRVDDEGNPAFGQALSRQSPRFFQLGLRGEF